MSIRRYRGTAPQGTDTWKLCPPRARAPHASADPGLGSSGLRASLLGLPVCHGHAFDVSCSNTNFDVHANLPCLVQIGVYLQSRTTPASQMQAVTDIQGRSVIGSTVVITPPFSRRREYLSW